MSSTSVGQIRTLPNPLIEQEIITFPFQIDFTGDADLDTYLQPEENENGVISGTFRGRPLFGEKVIPPENFDTVTVTTELRPTGQTLVNVTGTVKNILSYEYDRQPSKYTRLQKAMARCENNEWQKKEYLPELESDEIALNFIKSLQYPDLFENEDDEATSKGEQFYAWMEVMGLKGRKKEEDSKENVTILAMKLCTICILLMCFVLPVASEILSIIAGSSLVAGLGAGLGYFGWQKCFFDCCSEFKPINVIEQNLTTLFAEQLYGQHIAVPAIKNAIINHLKTREPRKALTLALHGITGTGKNYVASMVARSMFTKGMRSRNVHVINGNRHFYDEKEIHDFKNGLIHWIQGNLTSCSHSLFIFDEVDKLPSQVIDAIKPFIDHNIKITNADPRHSIFMFLSNTGSEVISQHALKYVQQGKARESISFIEMQEIVEASAYNQGEGGLKNSEIIGKHLIDYFIPFLPLTRTHVLLCIRDYAKQEGIFLTPEQEEKIAEGLTYFPRTSGSHAGVFSSSGCKHVANRVNLEKFQF